MRGEGDAAPEGEICPRSARDFPEICPRSAREKQPQASSPHKRRHHDCTPGSQVDTLSRVADSVPAAIAELRSSLLAGEMRLRCARDTPEIAPTQRAAHLPMWL